MTKKYLIRKKDSFSRGDILDLSNGQDSLTHSAIFVTVIVLVIQAYTMKSIYVDAASDDQGLPAYYYIIEMTSALVTMLLLSKIWKANHPGQVQLLTKDVSNFGEITDKETSISSTREISTQTDNKDYVKGIENIKTKHEIETKKIIRERRILKRRFAERISKIKKLAMKKEDELSELQIKIPQLEKEQHELVAEREAIDKQIEEEKNHYKGLVMKFQRLHSQFIQLGTLPQT